MQYMSQFNFQILPTKIHIVIEFIKNETSWSTTKTLEANHHDWFQQSIKKKNALFYYGRVFYCLFISNVCF